MRRSQVGWASPTNLDGLRRREHLAEALEDTSREVLRSIKKIVALHDLGRLFGVNFEVRVNHDGECDCEKDCMHTTQQAPP